MPELKRDEDTNCGTCLFFEHGACHRYPPTTTTEPGGWPDPNATGKWLPVKPYDWCGEWVGQHTDPGSPVPRGLVWHYP